MIDKAKIFSSILQKNALRREAQLPLLPVQATYRVEVEKELWIDYAKRNTARVQAEVLHELRAKHGGDFPQSWGGRLAWSSITHKVLREGFLAQR